MNSTPNQTPVIVKVTKYLPLVEKALLAALVIGIILTITGLDKTVTRVAFLGLGATFFLFAFRPIEIPRKENEPFGFSELLAFTIVPKVLWISSAVSCIGIVFYLSAFGNEGYKQQLMIGAQSIGIGTLILAALLAKGVKHLNTITPVLLRAIPLLLVDLYILFL